MEKNKANPNPLQDDIVADILERVRRLLGPSALLESRHWAGLDADIRRDWGGDRHYVSKKGEAGDLGKKSRDLKILLLRQQGYSFGFIAARVGVTRQRVAQICDAPK